MPGGGGGGPLPLPGGAGGGGALPLPGGGGSGALPLPGGGRGGGGPFPRAGCGGKGTPLCTACGFERNPAPAVTCGLVGAALRAARPGSAALRGCRACRAAVETVGLTDAGFAPALAGLATAAGICVESPGPEDVPAVAGLADAALTTDLVDPPAPAVMRADVVVLFCVPAFADALGAGGSELVDRVARASCGVTSVSGTFGGMVLWSTRWDRRRPVSDRWDRLANRCASQSASGVSFLSEEEAIKKRPFFPINPGTQHCQAPGGTAFKPKQA